MYEPAVFLLRFIRVYVIDICKLLEKSNLFLELYYYYLSGKLFALKTDDWYKYHIAFHFFIMCEQIIVIDSILKCSHVER